jgi:hypothetical protein
LLTNRLLERQFLFCSVPSLSFETAGLGFYLRGF